MPVSYFGSCWALRVSGMPGAVPSRPGISQVRHGLDLPCRRACVGGARRSLYPEGAAGADKLAAEAAHPVQCCFIGLAGVATMLIAGGLVPHERTTPASCSDRLRLHYVLCCVAHRRPLARRADPETTTAVIYLPTVTGSFVSASVASALGYSDWGQLRLWRRHVLLAGAGIRAHPCLLTGPTKAVELRPTLGIQLAPAPVAPLPISPLVEARRTSLSCAGRLRCPSTSRAGAAFVVDRESRCSTRALGLQFRRDGNGRRSRPSGGAW